MKSEGLKTKIYAGVVTVLLLIAVAGAGVLYDMRGDLQLGINQEKLNSEKLLSEKLQLDKEIASLNNELLSLNGKNTELGSQLEMSNKKVSEQGNSLTKLQKEHSNLKSLSKEVNSLKKLRDQLQVEIAGLKDANKTLTSSNENLAQTVATLQAENQSLKDKLKTAAVLKAGNFRVDVMRKNADKLTAKARQTKQVSVSFDLPSSAVASLGKSKVYLVITGPDGKPLAEENAQKKTILPEGVKTEITPSATQEVDLGKGPQRLSISFEPHQSMEKGIYKLDVYTDELYLGNSQFKLMK
ncbi:hypothetical protein BH09BAC1_BH09BAC1_17910 [soil metagenome]